MDRARRNKQTAVIFLAIVVLLLLLWHLHKRAPSGSLGSWASTNIFGPATLSLFSGEDTGSPQTPVQSNELELPTSNAAAPIAPSHLPPRPPGPSGARPGTVNKSIEYERAGDRNRRNAGGCGANAAGCDVGLERGRGGDD